MFFARFRIILSEKKGKNMGKGRAWAPNHIHCVQTRAIK